MSNYKIEEKETRLVMEAAVSYGITKHEMANLLGVSEKTFYNIMAKEVLDAERSDRFQFIYQILAAGQEVFETKESFAKWLRTPQPVFEGIKPIDLLATITGAQKVSRTLGRIKHGITA